MYCVYVLLHVQGHSGLHSELQSSQGLHSKTLPENKQKSKPKNNKANRTVTQQLVGDVLVPIKSFGLIEDQIFFVRISQSRML